MNAKPQRLPIYRCQYVSAKLLQAMELRVDALDYIAPEQPVHRHEETARKIDSVFSANISNSLFVHKKYASMFP